jgi:GTP cyclohydrolase II
MGYDTVQANLLLGHGADERRYDIAAAIMRDLGLEGVELLTNNPDKVKSLEKEGIVVVKRRAMVPRSWQQQRGNHEHPHSGVDGDEGHGHANRRIDGATLIGGGAAHGLEFEKYLRTKIERMGHMLDVPPSYES